MNQRVWEPRSEGDEKTKEEKCRNYGWAKKKVFATG